MSWIRLDDGYLEHPKFRRLIKLGGANALYLWHGAMAWCAQHLTDGVISGDMLDEPRGPTRPSARQRAWDALVQSGLCTRAAQEQHTSGAETARVQHVLHDYTHYQPSASSVRAAREDAARRKQLSRIRKLHTGSQCDADSIERDGHAPVTAPRAPDPDPHPDPHPGPAPVEEKKRAPPPEPPALPDPGPAAPQRAPVSASPARPTRLRPEPAEGTPLVWHTLKDWDPPTSLEDEAVMANISREYFRQRVGKAKNKPIGGRDGVLDREQWVRDQFPFWVVDERTQQGRTATGGLGMAAKQHNPGLTGFESFKETV